MSEEKYIKAYQIERKSILFTLRETRLMDSNKSNLKILWIEFCVSGIEQNYFVSKPALYILVECKEVFGIMEK